MLADAKTMTPSISTFDSPKVAKARLPIPFFWGRNRNEEVFFCAGW